MLAGCYAGIFGTLSNISNGSFFCENRTAQTSHSVKYRNFTWFPGVEITVFFYAVSFGGNSVIFISYVLNAILRFIVPALLQQVKITMKYQSIYWAFYTRNYIISDLIKTCWVDEETQESGAR